MGKIGKIVKVYGDGDLRVTIENNTWTFNPHSVSIVSSAPPAAASTDNNSNTLHANTEETKPSR